MNAYGCWNEKTKQKKGEDFFIFLSRFQFILHNNNKRSEKKSENQRRMEWKIHEKNVCVRSFFFCPLVCGVVEFVEIFRLNCLVFQHFFSYFHRLLFVISVSIITGGHFTTAILLSYFLFSHFFYFCFLLVYILLLHHKKK